jgi:SAM-dependent methyltransferase
VVIIVWIVGGIIALFLFTVLRGAPYVPSLPSGVREAFDELYQPTADDVVIDVGSGDGVVLREAARHGARVVGFEINPVLVAISRWRLRSLPHATVKWADFWITPFPDDVTVVYAFCNGRDIERLARKIQTFADEAKRPVYFVSYGFTLPSKKHEKRNKTSFLYKFDALQGSKAQV